MCCYQGMRMDAGMAVLRLTLGLPALHPTVLLLQNAHIYYPFFAIVPHSCLQDTLVPKPGA